MANETVNDQTNKATLDGTENLLIQEAAGGAGSTKRATTQAVADLGGGVSDADYLVGTAHAGLSAEIVVGTTPGGELGGTWASPTVDATHSGSSHAATQAAAEATAAAALASEAVLARNADNLTSGTVADARIASTIARDSEVTSAVAAEAVLARNADNLTSGTVAIARLPIDADVATLALPASTTISTFGASLVDDANAAAAIATLGLDADIATLSLPASTTITAAGAALIDDADATAQRATLGLVIGTNVQAFDADLSTYAGITPGALGQAILPMTTLTDKGLVLGRAAAAPAALAPDAATTKFLKNSVASGDPTWQLITEADVGGARVTFSNAAYGVQATDRYVGQVGTMSAPRTVTMPAANAVVAGTTIEIADESGTPSLTNYISIVPAGSDTLRNSHLASQTASNRISNGYGSMRYRSDGTSKWIAVEPGDRHAYGFFQHARTFAVPDSVWTPMPWALAATVDTDSAHGANSSTTTIAAGSNGVALPTGTINVASTTGFPSSGAITIQGPPGSGIDTIVRYTGVTATTFTGCTLGTGTMATSQNVRAANNLITAQSGALWNVVVDVGWVCNATGARRIRLYQDPFAINESAVPGIAADTTPTGTANDLVNQHQQMMSQPGNIAGGTFEIQVWQNSGGVLNIALDGLVSPTFEYAWMSSR